MPDDSRKKQSKVRNEPKEQRRPRNQAGPVEHKNTKRHEQKGNGRPAYNEPSADFSKNLKKESDEILKITDEETSKYKKKEIQSNWAKYEMPIESYDEMQEQENIGADYEKLIEAPLSIGGHFQFQHEKSWDADTGPNLYDKYFEINMDHLYLSISTIPLYERNRLNKEHLTEVDILTMESKAAKAKQKYKEKVFSASAVKVTPTFVAPSPTEVPQINLVNINLKLEKYCITNEAANKNVTDIVGTDNFDHDLFESKTHQDIENTQESVIDLLKENQISPSELIQDIGPDDNKGKSTGETASKNEEIGVIDNPEDLEKWLDDFLDE